ncbi:MAG: 3-hydroxyacyl-CoA dehydrogenase NAD-binding domain-containing protein, partial [Halobacteria archaeon]|nr:3-hydroxyacyl-CoA dehydrogenase NAD-binding domain-containing protein [Halobacteria archaeon]
GYDVKLRDINQDLVQEGYDSIKDSVERLEDKEKVEDADAVLGRIDPVVEMEKAVSGADFVIEAVPERFDVKREVWTEADELAPEHAVFGTNTSSISITELANVTERPESFIGMHFFNPPVIMELVEIIRGDRTSDETLETTKSLAEDFDKVPIVVRKDPPGFISNRVLMPYINEACWIVYEGEANMKQVDAIKNKLNIPMGPFELADYIGNDVSLDIMEYLQEEIGDVFEPCPMLVEKVDEGKLGNKSGEGFYDHSREIVIPAGEHGIDPTRVMCTMVNEGAKLIENGVSNAEDIDTVMKLGMAFKKGPMRYADEKGLNRFVEELNNLHKKYGHPRYEVADHLREKAEKGETFY